MTLAPTMPPPAPDAAPGRTPAPRRRASWPRRAVRAALAAVAVLLALVTAAAFVLARTGPGHEMVRRFLVARLGGAVHGTVRVGRLDGDLLREVVLRDVSLADSAGAPVLGVRAIRARLDVWALVSRRIEISRLELDRPALIARRERDGAWNVARLFAKPERTGTPSAGSRDGFGHWVRIANVAVRGGSVAARLPWEGDTTAGATRARVERTERGPERVIVLRAIDAELPRLLLAHPDTARIVVDVARASVVAEPFRSPAAELRNLAGTLTVAGDTLRLAGGRVAFPGSRLTTELTYVAATGALRAHLRADTLALGDLRWLRPSLPPEGHAAFTADAERPAGGALDVRVTDLVARLGGAEATGTAGATLGDTVRVHDTDLHLTNVATALVERLAPGLRLTVRGTVLDARATLEGTLAALRTDASLTFREAAGATSAAAAAGQLTVRPALAARGLRVTLRPLQTSLVRALAPSVPLRGTVAGTATVDGSAAGGWRVAGDLTHVDRGARSRLVGSGDVGAGARTFGLDVRLLPLSLDAVARAAPSLGLRGAVSGQLTANGTRDAATFRTALRFADGGALHADGVVSRAPAGLGYDVVLRPDSLDPRTVSARLPAGALTGLVAAHGEGTDARTMRAEVTAALDGPRLDSVALDSLRLVARVAGGVATVDSLRAWVPGARLHSAGTLGLVPERVGELRYDVRADSLGALLRWLRPGDSARADSSLPRGAVAAEGVLRGSVDTLRATGRAVATALALGGDSVARARADYVLGVRHDDTLSVAATLESMHLGHLAYERAEARYAGGRRAGAAELRVRQSARAEYALRGALLRPGVVQLTEWRMRFDSAEWRLRRPARLSWDSGTYRVDSLDLRRFVPDARGGEADVGAIRASGAMRPSLASDLGVQVQGAALRDGALLLQRDLPLDARLSTHLRGTGSTASPILAGDALLEDVVVRGDSVPEIRGDVVYRLGRLGASARLGPTNAPLVTADASVPVNLALAGVTGPRLRRRDSLVATVAMDSLPLVLLPRRPQVQVLGGWARGAVAVRGTLDEPRASGRLAVRDGALRVVQTGTTLRALAAGARLTSDSVVLDSLVATSNGPVRASGSVVVARGAPHVVAATLTARDAALLDGPQGTLHASADLALSGTVDSLLLGGRAEALHGYFERKGPSENAVKVLQAGAAELFTIMDTSAFLRRRSLPPREPPTRIFHADVALRIHPDVWYRSATNANVEVVAPRELRIRADLASGDLAAGGLVLTRGGIYVFRLRPFTIVRGVAMLPGVAHVPPLLQVSGEHEVWIAGRGMLPVRILINGSTGNLRFTLGDAAALPAAPPDLPSYLSLGRSPVSLLQHEGSSLAGLSTSGAGLGGALGALARRQEVTPALGAVLYQFAKGLRDAAGLNLFTATPSDVPPELAESRWAGAAGTAVEGGYLFGTKTYLGARMRLAWMAPGLHLVREVRGGATLRAAWEPRFLVGRPALGPAQQGTVRRALGVFIGKDWWF